MDTIRGKISSALRYTKTLFVREKPLTDENGVPLAEPKSVEVEQLINQQPRNTDKDGDHKPKQVTIPQDIPGEKPGPTEKTKPEDNATDNGQRTPTNAEVLDRLEKQMPLPASTAIPESVLEQKERFPNIFEERPPAMNYELQFVDFMNRNGPQGFAQKLHTMLPFLGVSFIAWPTFWLYRGYSWQQYRSIERIEAYIHRTFQHAKFMQVAIITAGLLLATMKKPTPNLTVHESHGRYGCF
ncbi:uncharacterized protein LOC115632878 isoform X2 [Scaptodrosophila lebanonensis]|uniref:Uncharacterized protein LOC115632878 isoform X2 n=1 Tax=Drosophila lebanonensis TaxID=7225 RepID=A0A6J2UD06_DROLE|nr:uncharacterized protein LOC115632878 isoform X2 [Scaptodrosophila lebanonensis]